MRDLRALYKFLRRDRRRQLLGTVTLMALGAIAEVFTIGAVLPFLAVFSGGGSPSVQMFYQKTFGVAGSTSLLLASAILILSGLISGAVRLVLAKSSLNLVMNVGHDIAATMFRHALYQPYSAFVNRNSSELLSAVEKVHPVVTGVLQPAMQGATSAVLAICLAVAMFFINPTATLLGGLVIGCAYASIAAVVRRKLRRNSSAIARAMPSRMKVVQEASSGIAQIIVDNGRERVVSQFCEVDQHYRQAQTTNIFISNTPRHIIEAAAVISVVVLIAATASEQGSFNASIPALGAIALGAQRLLPLLQQVWHGWSVAGGNLSSLHDVLELLKLEVEHPSEIKHLNTLSFEKEIVFDAVTYSHESGVPVLENVSLSIKRGDRIGIAGRSGRGKTTLLHLLLGLLAPSCGHIRIDGIRLSRETIGSWQRRVGYAPQSVHLIDDTIAANIAFPQAESDWDIDRLANAARVSLLEGLISNARDGIRTRVGENGTRLSGGERQRIGIARAIYKDPQVLVLDEATSGLDVAMEETIWHNIIEAKPDLTIIVVTHRPSVLRLCSDVIHL